MNDLTPEEKKAIASLKRLAKTWPESLWLFSASGSLHVMRKDEHGNKVHNPYIPDSFSSESVVATINIENDGGDW
jgi:hypothetical protein